MEESPSLKAAAYVRMSTGRQVFSIENQMAAINNYAELRQIAIIETYSDEGISGLTMDARPALKSLLQTVISGAAQFSAILVSDVSRWGRFQDIDESAYYEFICKKAGIHIHYVGEPFQNDNSSLSSIIKSIKRIMAAEYSRELSNKVRQARLNLASQGYRQGGAAGYGYRRAAVDKDGNVEAILGRYDRKSRPTERITLIPGPKDEKVIVNRIYRLFVYSNYSALQIARVLNFEDIKGDQGKKWTKQMVLEILSNEKYIGNNVFGKRLWSLRERTMSSPDSWLRIKGAFKPLVSNKLFRLAREKLKLSCKENKKTYSDEELLEFLRTLYREKGSLSLQKILKAEDHPPAYLYARRFGNLHTAYKAIGYQSTYLRGWALKAVLLQIAADTARRLERMFGATEVLPGSILGTTRLICLKNGLTLYIVPCRAIRPGPRCMQVSWEVRITAANYYDYALIIRMDEKNLVPNDYYLIPSHDVNRNANCFPHLQDLDIQPYYYKDIQDVGDTLRACLN